MPPLGCTVLSVGSTTAAVAATVAAVAASVGSVATAVKLLTMPRHTASADVSPALSSLLRPYNTCSIDSTASNCCTAEMQ
jgi:hypothetical protein